MTNLGLNKNAQHVPPSIKEAMAMTISRQMKIVGYVLFFVVVLLCEFSSFLSSAVIFGGYLWVIALVFFFIYVVVVSNKINRYLKGKKTDIAIEYNKYRDSH